MKAQRIRAQAEVARAAAEFVEVYRREELMLVSQLVAGSEEEARAANEQVDVALERLIVSVEELDR